MACEPRRHWLKSLNPAVQADGWKWPNESFLGTDTVSELQFLPLVNQLQRKLDLP